MRRIKLRHVTRQVGADSYALVVPIDIAKLILERGIEYFTCILTEEGILYIPEKQTEEHLPAWLSK